MGNILKNNKAILMINICFCSLIPKYKGQPSYMSDATYSLELTLNDKKLNELKKIFHGNYIYSQRFRQKSAEMKSSMKSSSFILISLELSNLGSQVY